MTAEKNSIQRASGRERGSGESRLAGEATASAGILERLPDEIRGELLDELVDGLLAGA
jgi:hypothetical protein